MRIGDVDVRRTPWAGLDPRIGPCPCLFLLACGNHWDLADAQAKLRLDWSGLGCSKNASCEMHRSTRIAPATTRVGLKAAPRFFVSSSQTAF
jgi:hypothetical protein